MKMAKASKEDIRMVRRFFDVLEEYVDYGTYTEPSDDTEAKELTPEEFSGLVSQMMKRGVGASWWRVVCGCEILIDNVCDPNASVLEWHPLLANQITASEAVDPVLEYLHGDKERFRSILLDKNELLAKVCDYAACEAESQGYEPWLIVKEIMGHGSGVSSAIYELYRRKPEGNFSQRNG